MVFSETILPPGKMLYKGFKSVSCQALLKDTRNFYLTENLSTAKSYGHACKYRTKRTLRLFDMSHANISNLLAFVKLKPETRELLKVALGTRITVGQQVRAARLLFGPKHTGKLPRSINTRPGQRLSYKDLNKMVFSNFSKEFLIPEGYDGYYAPRKQSVFHYGSFHSEIMLVNAYQSIERVTATGRAPVISSRSFKWALPKLFADFCKGTTRLVRPYGGGLTLFCTGGMAVRMYLKIQGQSLSEKVRRTSDFDFTFAVPRRLPSESAVTSYVFTMREIMTKHLTAFIRWLNTHYKGINARLKVTNFTRSPYDNPRIQVPGTGRRVYQVITYQIVTGKNEVTDLVDTALAVYPGASRSMIHIPFSYKIGIPVQRLRYQLKDSLALLSGSFVYGGLISKRNPIKGQAKEKGRKNAERTVGLLKVVNKRKTYYKNLVPAARAAAPLLESVFHMNLKKAKKNALKVNKALKKIK